MDHYQPVFDAVRSVAAHTFSGPSAFEAVSQAVSNAFFDVGPVLMQEISIVGAELIRPSRTMRPKLSIDGNQWCVLYGDNLQDGVAGFGDTPEMASEAFDAAWLGREGK